MSRIREALCLSITTNPLRAQHEKGYNMTAIGRFLTTVGQVMIGGRLVTDEAC